MQINLKLNKESYVPAVRQIADGLRKAAIEGTLTPGQPIPSIRELADHLDVSRSTVMRALEDLVSQGYLKSMPGRGTFVAESLPGEARSASYTQYESDQASARQEVRLSQFGRRLLKHSLLPADWDQMVTANPAIDMIPLSTWKQLLYRHCSMKDRVLIEYQEECFGYPPLRDAYAAYVRRARAVNATADRVVVFSARELRADLLCRLLVEPGDYVAVENPGYRPIREKFLSYGANLVHVPVDDQGMDVDYLIRVRHKVKLVHVTPSHHEPLGSVLSMDRRRRLLEWASRTGALILEDDYDSEFRYGSRPLPSLQGMDTTDSTIFIGCFWKIIAPVCTLGFLVIPNRLKKPMAAAKLLVERDPPLIDQFALTDFINEGHLERHIRRLRGRYASRREALVKALHAQFGDKVTPASETAGMDLLFHLDTVADDAAVLRLAAQAEFDMASSASYYHGEGRKGEFIVPFAGLSEEALQSGVRKLAKLLRSEKRSD